MKYLTIIITLTISFCFHSTVQGQQTETRTFTRSATFSDSGDHNRFVIRNLFGNVTIQEHSGNSVELTIEEEIRGNSSAIEQARDELEYVLERDGNRILAYLTAPFINIRRHEDHISYNVNMNDRDYRFTHNITVRVPGSASVDASTIDDGLLSVTGDFPEIKADNVNGDIILREITSAPSVSTVNGDIEITYAANPSSDSKFQTVNGEITVRFPQNLSADIYFSSMHGDLYTDFQNVTRLSPEVSRETRSAGKSISYRVEKNTPVRIGSGGPKLRFELLNGDAYVRKI